MLNIALDMAWLLQNGYDLQCFHYTDELYDKRLRVKGYRDHSGKTSIKKLAQDIASYYGREFLVLNESFNSGACIWIKRIIQHSQRFRHPLHHLLLMRFLAGSVEAFFMGPQEEPPEYLPFGAPPYPCRNYVCDYHLQDVIMQIELRRTHATPYATFICPYCGFSYNRKGNVPKEKHYSGQIHILEYGWRWEDEVAALLAAGESPYKIAHEFHCDVRTILAFGVDRGLLPQERHTGRKPYVPSEMPKERPNLDDQRALYRRRWLDIIAENQAVTRNEVVQQMRERGELMTVYKVRHAANIEDRERKLDGFILELIENVEQRASVNTCPV